MMSLVLKSVMAAKRESVAKCAGPLQYGVGRPDGANTMIKTIQYSRRLITPESLLLFDLKAAFQNVSRSAMLYSIAQTDADLAAVFSKWYTGTTEHRMHCDSAYTKTSANSGVDQGCPLSTCGFSAAVDPVFRSVLAEICTHYDLRATLFAYLVDWYLWIKPQYLLQTIAVITAATRSVNLALQSTKTQVWKGFCQDSIPPEFQDKVTLTLSCLGGHLQIHGDTEPSPVVLGEQATMEKITQRFQKIATTLADLNAEGLNAQAVNDLLTMYVGAASQHVLRMSFVPEQEAHNFDRQVMTFWSHFIHRDITSRLLFFYSSSLADLEWALQFNATLLLHGALQAILLSQSTSHTGAHLMQPSSEAYEAEDRCFRVLPHPAAPNAADVVQFCPNKSAAGVICNKPVDPQQHHCYGCRYGGGVDRRHAAVGRCHADVIQSHSGAKGIH